MPLSLSPTQLKDLSLDHHLTSWSKDKVKFHNKKFWMKFGPLVEDRLFHCFNELMDDEELYLEISPTPGLFSVSTKSQFNPFSFVEMRKFCNWLRSDSEGGITLYKGIILQLLKAREESKDIKIRDAFPILLLFQVMEQCNHR